MKKYLLIALLWTGCIHASVDSLVQPFKGNYVLPLYSNSSIVNNPHYQTDDAGTMYDNSVEMAMMLSFKIPLYEDILDSGIDTSASYKQKSHWQAYSLDDSSPFRANDYEPAFTISRHQVATVNYIGLSLIHNSNGQVDSLSRSWNRVEGEVVLQAPAYRTQLAIVPYLRIGDIDGPDENPDIHSYYGHGYLELTYTGDVYKWTVMSRNNLESWFTRGYVRVTLERETRGALNWLVYVSAGYGESLISYDVSGTNIGIGFSF